MYGISRQIVRMFPGKVVCFRCVLLPERKKKITAEAVISERKQMCTVICFAAAAYP